MSKRYQLKDEKYTGLQKLQVAVLRFLGKFTSTQKVCRKWEKASTKYMGQKTNWRYVCNYFVDEFNAITEYYNTKSDVEQGRSRYYSNYHGKIGKDGKMKPGGNGGRFRYFNQIIMPDGEIRSLNALLQSAEESNDPKLIKETLDNIRKLFIEDVAGMYDILNKMLLRRVDQEVEEAIKLGVISRD